jgi:hypothetical protein
VLGVDAPLTATETRFLPAQIKLFEDVFHRRPSTSRVEGCQNPACLTSRP